jgi:hypothetical protein
MAKQSRNPADLEVPVNRRLLAAVTALAVGVPLSAHALATAPALTNVRDVSGLKAVMTDAGVHLTWPRDSNALTVLRDGQPVSHLAKGVSQYDDKDATPGAVHSYRVGTAVAGGARGAGARITTPDYLLGAATRDITPKGVVNIGGFGLGDGSAIPQDVVGRGGRDQAKSERISVRATVVDDGKNAIAIADIEVQGWFAAYEFGTDGLSDMAAAIAKDVKRLPADHIVIASDHSHSAPDTIGAWGGPSNGYLDLVKFQVIAAVKAAYAQRSYVSLVAGHSDASDLVYNQACTEGLNQSKNPDYPGPSACAVPGKDGMFRVLQATTPSGKHPLTYAVYAAHATAGGGNGITGDWPQFLSDVMTKKYGGVGLAMVGSLGGTQPCRPTCAFTKPTNPGYNVADRKTALMANYSAHVASALKTAKRVHGPVAAAKGFIREPLVGPAVVGLFAAGQHLGAHLLRSKQPPWANAQTIRTVVGALRIGGVVLAATPGEGFPAIRQGVEDAVGSGAQEVIALGLANDQLGYLISPASYVPVIAAEVAVNDDIIFNVSPTIGDHVECADITLVGLLGLKVVSPPTCLGYVVEDSAGDPIGSVPVGGITLP